MMDEWPDWLRWTCCAICIAFILLWGAMGFLMILKAQ